MPAERLANRSGRKRSGCKVFGMGARTVAIGGELHHDFVLGCVETSVANVRRIVSGLLKNGLHRRREGVVDQEPHVRVAAAVPALEPPPTRTAGPPRCPRLRGPAWLRRSLRGYRRVESRAVPEQFPQIRTIQQCYQFAWATGEVERPANPALPLPEQATVGAGT